MKHPMHHLSRFFSHLRPARLGAIAIAGILALSLSACLPSGEQKVNTDLFKDKQDMAAKSGSLRVGMNQEEAFKTVGVPANKFERMSMHEVQMSYYGNASVQGSAGELEQFRQRMMKMQGYYLPYREIKSSSSLGFGKMKVEKTGHDLRLVMIFDRDKLVHTAVEGTQNVRQNDDRYMWDSLINRGIGAAF